MSISPMLFTLTKVCHSLTQTHNEWYIVGIRKPQILTIESNSYCKNCALCGTLGV